MQIYDAASIDIGPTIETVTNDCSTVYFHFTAIETAFFFSKRVISFHAFVHPRTVF